MGIFDFLKKSKPNKCKECGDFIQSEFEICFECNKVKKPKWFDGKWYDEGADVTNPYTFKKYKLSPAELSIYDFIIGSSMSVNSEEPDKIVEKAIEWFKEKNPEAYTNCVLPYIT